jgi:hypothetical protein
MQFPLAYPLSVSFKIVALAPQLSVRDANGNLIAYVRQKLFKLKEAVTVYSDEGQTQPVFAIKWRGCRVDQARRHALAVEVALPDRRREQRDAATQH